MKKILLSISLILIATIAFSNDSKKEALVEELLELMNTKAMMDTAYDQMDGMIKNMHTQFGVTESEQHIFEDYQSKVTSLMKQEFNWAKLEGPMKDTYMDVFSEKEIQDLIKFYQSETGKAFITKMPEIMKRSMQQTQELLKDFLPKSQELARQLQVDLMNVRK